MSAKSWQCRTILETDLLQCSFVFVMATNNGMRWWSTKGVKSCLLLNSLICSEGHTSTDWLTLMERKVDFCSEDGIFFRDSSHQELRGSGWALTVIWKTNRYQTYLLRASRYKTWQTGDLQPYCSWRDTLVHLKWHQTLRARKASYGSDLALDYEICVDLSTWMLSAKAPTCGNEWILDLE